MNDKYKKVEGENKFLVLKWDDIRAYCDSEQFKQIDAICKTIETRREASGKGINSYLICNQDESYAPQILALILRGEEFKQANKICSKPSPYLR